MQGAQRLANGVSRTISDEIKDRVDLERDILQHLTEIAGPVEHWSSFQPDSECEGPEASKRMRKQWEEQDEIAYGTCQKLLQLADKLDLLGDWALLSATGVTPGEPCPLDEMLAVGRNLLRQWDGILNKEGEVRVLLGHAVDETKLQLDTLRERAAGDVVVDGGTARYWWGGTHRAEEFRRTLLAGDRSAVEEFARLAADTARWACGSGESARWIWHLFDTVHARGVESASEAGVLLVQGEKPFRSRWPSFVVAEIATPVQESVRQINAIICQLKRLGEKHSFLATSVYGGIGADHIEKRASEILQGPRLVAPGSEGPADGTDFGIETAAGAKDGVAGAGASAAKELQDQRKPPGKPDWQTIADIEKRIKKLAPTELSILLLGETGTGKEYYAEKIHRASLRKNGPFVAINCAALPKERIDSELFGYVKGAFTGAQQDYPGKIRQAQGGTVFLDEIGELPEECWGNLLRFLHAKEIHPLGGKTAIVDVRILAATNKPDRIRVEARHRFKHTLRLPPLRARRGDIPALAKGFFESAMKDRPNATQLRFRLEDIEDLARADYDWPGNLRQLENAILTAVDLHDSGRNLTSREVLEAAKSADDPV